MYRKKRTCLFDWDAVFCLLILGDPVADSSFTCKGTSNINIKQILKIKPPFGSHFPPQALFCFVFLRKLYILKTNKQYRQTRLCDVLSGSSSLL